MIAGFSRFDHVGRYAETARALSETKEGRAEIPVPVDVVVGGEFSADAPASVRDVSGVEDGDLILDIGPQTAANFAALLEQAGTIIWNGPVGVFEFDQFGEGTKALAEAIVDETNSRMQRDASDTALGRAFTRWLDGEFGKRQFDFSVWFVPAG